MSDLRSGMKDWRRDVGIGLWENGYQVEVRDEGLEERELVTMNAKLLLVVTHIGAMSTNSAHSTSKYKTGELKATTDIGLRSGMKDWRRKLK